MALMEYTFLPLFFILVVYHLCICWWHFSYNMYILLRCKWPLCPNENKSWNCATSPEQIRNKSTNKLYDKSTRNRGNGVRALLTMTESACCRIVLACHAGRTSGINNLLTANPHQTIQDGPKTPGHRLMTIILSSRNRYKKITERFLSKWILKIPPHLVYVATLPCQQNKPFTTNYKVV